MRAMILAAGYGTRLWPLTIDRTKPAIPVMGRPLVGYVAEYLSRYDCSEVVVNLHHQPESVRAALGDGRRFGVQLHYVYEPEILGTSGALDNARHLLEGDTFVVINGKIITDIDLLQALETHRRTKALATLVLKRNHLRERFSIVETKDGMITGFGGMPARASDNAGDDAASAAQNNGGGRAEHDSDGQAGQGSQTVDKSDAEREYQGGRTESDVPLMFTGIQILEPRIFDYIPRGVFSHSTTDVYPQAIAQGEVVAAHIAEGMWHELSTIHRYLEINLALMAAEGHSFLKGERCEVEAGAEVSDSIMWDDVMIEAGARAHHAVLADGVRLRAGEEVEDAAVVRAELVRGSVPPPKALKGEFRGANFVVPLPR